MKKFRVGDKVRLIDEAAECEISRIVSDNKVAIRDQNGFEYIVNIGEIVPLFSKENLSPGEKKVSPEIIQNRSEPLQPYFSNTAGLFLCAIPENADTLLNTSYKIYLVNSSEEIILYSLHEGPVRDGASFFGVLGAKEEFFAGIFSPQKPKASLSFRLKFIIHTPDEKVFLHEASFTPEDFTDEKLFLSPALFRKHILSFACMAQDEIKIPEENITKLIDHFSPVQKKSQAKEKVQRRKNSDEPLFTNEKTVDLHIEELTDDYNHMSNTEIITLQLNHFHKELDTAILKHYYRIIFIHGKGNGVLRSRIRSELDAMNLKYRDADTSRFGFGATEVLL